MKHLFTLLFVSVFFWNSKAINKFNPPVDSTATVLIGFVKNNPNTKTSDVKEFIKSLNGVNSVLFCDNHSSFIININRSSIIYNKESFVNQIINIFPQDIFTFKGDAGEILQYCTYNDPIDAQTIKSN